MLPPYLPIDFKSFNNGRQLLPIRLIHTTAFSLSITRYNTDSLNFENKQKNPTKDYETVVIIILLDAIHIINPKNKSYKTCAKTTGHDSTVVWSFFSV
jgi:uncharacterized membrane protein